jgi:hypothetical protein
VLLTDMAHFIAIHTQTSYTTWHTDTDSPLTLKRATEQDQRVRISYFSVE